MPSTAPKALSENAEKLLKWLVSEFGPGGQVGDSADAIGKYAGLPGDAKGWHEGATYEAVRELDEADLIVFYGHEDGWLSIRLEEKQNA